MVKWSVRTSRIGHRLVKLSVEMAGIVQTFSGSRRDRSNVLHRQLVRNVSGGFRFGQSSAE